MCPSSSGRVACRAAGALSARSAAAALDIGAGQLVERDLLRVGAAQSHLESAVQAERDPLVRLRALVFVQYQRCEAQAALLDPQLAPAGASAVEQQELYATLHGMLAQAIAEGQRAGAVRMGDAAVLAALCLELLGPRAFQNLARVVDGDAEEVAEQVVRFVLGGLGAG